VDFNRAVPEKTRSLKKNVGSIDPFSKSHLLLGRNGALAGRSAAPAASPPSVRRPALILRPPPPPLRVKANATRTPPSILWSSLDLIEKHSRGLKRWSALLRRRPPALPPHLPPPAGSSPQRSSASPNATAPCAEDGCSHRSNPLSRPMPVRAQQTVIKPLTTTTHRRCTTPE
jgi:hypothetical protein